MQFPRWMLIFPLNRYFIDTQAPVDLPKDGEIPVTTFIGLDYRERESGVSQSEAFVKYV